MIISTKLFFGASTWTSGHCNELGDAARQPVWGQKFPWRKEARCCPWSSCQRRCCPTLTTAPGQISHYFLKTSFGQKWKISFGIFLLKKFRGTMSVCRLHLANSPNNFHHEKHFRNKLNDLVVLKPPYWCEDYHCLPLSSIKVERVSCERTTTPIVCVPNKIIKSVALPASI